MAAAASPSLPSSFSLPPSAPSAFRRAVPPPKGPAGHRPPPRAFRPAAGTRPGPARLAPLRTPPSPDHHQAEPAGGGEGRGGRAEQVRAAPGSTCLEKEGRAGGKRLSRPERSGCYGERGPLPVNEYSRGGRCGPVAPSRASPARERCRTSPRVTTAAPPHTPRVLILALSAQGKALRGGAGEGGAAATATTASSSSRRPRGRPCGGTPRSRWRWGGERERGRLIDGYPGDAGAPAPPARRSQWAGAAGPAGCGAI